MFWHNTRRSPFWDLYSFRVCEVYATSVIVPLKIYWRDWEREEEKQWLFDSFYDNENIVMIYILSVAIAAWKCSSGFFFMRSLMNFKAIFWFPNFAAFIAAEFLSSDRFVLWHMSTQICLTWKHFWTYLTSIRNNAAIILIYCNEANVFASIFGKALAIQTNTWKYSDLRDTGDDRLYF